MPRRAAVDLVAQLAHEDVHRAIAPASDGGPRSAGGARRGSRPDPAPTPTHTTTETPSASTRNSPHPQTPAHSADPPPTPQSRSAHPDAHPAPAPPAAPQPHPSHQLLHRKRLHQIIIRTNLQRMHPIMLRPPRRHHHNRRPNPLRTRQLNQLPTINPRQHQIQHTHIRTLKRNRANPASPFPTHNGSNPAACKCRAIPCAITSSSSTINTFGIPAIITPSPPGLGCVLVNES